MKRILICLKGKIKHGLANIRKAMFLYAVNK